MPDLQPLLRRARRLLARYRRLTSALLAGIAVLAVVETVAPAAPASVPVVVAAHDLGAGTVVSPGDVRVVDLPPNAVPGGASRSAVALVGRVVAGPLRTGEALTDRRVLGHSLLAGYPPGLVAAPVRLQDAAVVGLLQVGQRIDVYAARRDSPLADRVVDDVRVITLPRPPDDAQEGALAVLAVTPGQAAALAQASATAPLTVTLSR